MPSHASRVLAGSSGSWGKPAGTRTAPERPNRIGWSANHRTHAGESAGSGATLGEWYAVAVAALRSWPVGRAAVRDVPGMGFWIDRADDRARRWRVTAGLTTQRRRRAGILQRVFGPSPVDTTPVEPNRWAAERVFSTRPEMVDGIGGTLPALVNELRGQVGAAWPPPPRRR